MALSLAFAGHREYECALGRARQSGRFGTSPPPASSQLQKALALTARTSPTRSPFGIAWNPSSESLDRYVPICNTTHGEFGVRQVRTFIASIGSTAR